MTDEHPVFGFQLPDDQASRDRLAELGQLAGALVHELKNPLGAIDLNATLIESQLEREQLDRAKLATRIGRIRSSSRHLHDIVESFLAFARPGRPERERVDVNALLERLLDDHEEVFAEAGIQVVRSFDPDLLAVPADSRHLHAAFLNIVVNAIDALRERPEGRKLIVATRTRRNAAGVVIANNGPALSANAAAHLFDPFYSEKEHGTGLGLAIVQRLVELHRGRVAVHSDPAQGVSFTVDLPTNLGPARDREALPMPAKEVEAIVREADPATRGFRHPGARR